MSAPWQKCMSVGYQRGSDLGQVQSLERHRDIGYHLAEAEAWLSASGAGKHTTLLSYAAFEMRIEIERVALELLGRIQGDDALNDLGRTARQFDRMERAVYELEGHQRELGKKVSFGNLMLSALQIDYRIPEVNLGRLRAGWHKCSELCHVTWSLRVDSPGGIELGEEFFVEMAALQRYLRELVSHGITWLRVADASFGALQDQYVRGEASDDDVQAWFEERGIWSKITRPDGSSEFIGTPVPPRPAE